MVKILLIMYGAKIIILEHRVLLMAENVSLYIRLTALTRYYGIQKLMLSM